MEEVQKDNDRSASASLKKIIKDMGVIGLSKILISVSGIILLPVLTRFLGAYGYGLWTNSKATIGVVLPILLLGLHSAVIRFFPSKDKESRGKDFFSIMLLVSFITIIFSTVLFIYPKPLANFFFEGEEFIVKIVALIIFVWCLDTLFIRSFQAFREMKKYATVRVLTTYSEIGLAIFLVIKGYGVVGALLAVLSVRTMLLVILTFVFSKRFGIHTPNISNLKNIREYLDYGIPMIPSNLSYWAISTSDRFVISYFLGITYVGYYSPGYIVGKTIPFMMGGTALFVLQPALADIFDDGNVQEVKKILNLSIKYTFIVAIPFFFGILLFHEEITALLSTDEIARQGSYIAIYTALTGLVYILVRTFEVILNLVKKTKIIGGAKTISAIFNIAANIILIPYIGILGAAITTFLAYAIIAVIYILMTRKYIPLKLDLVGIFKICIASLGMYFSLILILYYWKIYFLYLVPIGILMYFGLLFSIKGFSKKEIDFLKSLI